MTPKRRRVYVVQADLLQSPNRHASCASQQPCSATISRRRRDVYSEYTRLLAWLWLYSFCSLALLRSMPTLQVYFLQHAMSDSYIFVYKAIRCPDRGSLGSDVMQDTHVSKMLKILQYLCLSVHNNNNNRHRHKKIETRTRMRIMLKGISSKET